METNDLGRPNRKELWRAFEKLMGIAVQGSSSSTVARQLLLFSHFRNEFDVGLCHRFDSSNRVAATVVLTHAVTGGDDREFRNFLCQIWKDRLQTRWTTNTQWLKEVI